MDTKALLELAKEYGPILKAKELELSALDNQGYCNYNYLITADKKRYILRLFGSKEIDRKSELDLQNIAYKSGLGPEILLFCHDKRFMLIEYIDAKQKKKLDRNHIETLSITLLKLHSIKCDISKVKVNLEDDIVSSFTKELVLCHNDLNPQNILWPEDKAILIDWEYACLNDKYFDIASIIVEFELKGKNREYFLENYFANSEKINPSKLESFIIYYKKVCKIWWNKRKENH